MLFRSVDPKAHEAEVTFPAESADRKATQQGGEAATEGEEDLAEARKVLRQTPDGWDFTVVPTGTFYMGSPAGEAMRERDEVPRRAVIKQPFLLGTYEVTLGQWLEIMEKPPRITTQTKKDLPVIATATDILQFIQRLNKRERKAGRLLDGWKYRLPTEAEWKFACRAGTRTAYSFGDNPDDLTYYAWFKANSGGTLHPVGTKRPNRWGLYDMHGNIMEVCKALPYKDEHGKADAQSTSETAALTFRGGFSRFPASMCRSASGYEVFVRPESAATGVRLALAKCRTPRKDSPTESASPKNSAVTKNDGSEAESDHGTPE